MKLSRTLFTTTALGLIGGAVLLALANPPWQATAQSGVADQETLEAFERFQRAVQSVNFYYVDEVSASDLIDSAIDGMLSDLDPHSGFLNAESMTSLTEGVSGNFGGLGIQIDLFESVVRVIAPIDGTPAYKAGLKAGDLITALDGEPIYGKSLDEAIDIMRGEIGTEITLTVFRQATDEGFDVTIKRGLIPEVSVLSRIEADNVGYLRISNFSGRTGEELEEAITKVLTDAEGPIAGFVLDLRSNPGGALQGSVDVVDAFLDEGEIVSTRSRGGQVDSRYSARRGDFTAGLPLVVLIDGGSASASEIVAAALQDHQRAIIMGQRSFGKGSVQNIVPLSDETGMKLTTALYYSPAGTSIQGVGVVPDIEVRPATIEYLDSEPSYREENLSNSIERDTSNQTEAEQDGEEAKPTDDLEDKPELGEAVKPEYEAEDSDGDGLSEQLLDYPLERAVDLIQALALADRLNG